MRKDSGKNLIPFVDLKAQEALIGKEIRSAIDRVISHGKFIMGPEVHALETVLSEYIGSKYVISCSSGTDALLMALMAVGIGPGDAVLTTPFTFVATAEVICMTGATPVFVDIDPNTFNIDPDQIDKTLKDLKKKGGNPASPKCIIPVDLFGLPADYVAIKAIAREHQLKVIADGAQSFGAKIAGVSAGLYADIATTSFFPAKPLGCYGDGGAVFTENASLCEKLISIRSHGKGRHKYENICVGLNGRLDTIQAAVLIEKLKIFENEMKRRIEISDAYRNQIGDVLQCQLVPEAYTSACAQFSFLVSDRRKTQDALNSRGIPTAVYYPRPLHLQKAFEKLGYRAGDFPVAEKTAGEILSIPMHPYLSDAQVMQISRSVKRSVG